MVQSHEINHITFAVTVYNEHSIFGHVEKQAHSESSDQSG